MATREAVRLRIHWRVSWLEGVGRSFIFSKKKKEGQSVEWLLEVSGGRASGGRASGGAAGEISWWRGGSMIRLAGEAAWGVGQWKSEAAGDASGVAGESAGWRDLLMGTAAGEVGYLRGRWLGQLVVELVERLLERLVGGGASWKVTEQAAREVAGEVAERIPW